MDYSLPGSSAHGILQIRILEWVAATPWTAAYQALPSMGFSRQEYWSGLPLPSPIETLAVAASLQSCPTLCNPMDCSLPGFSIHGILQARTLEWVAISLLQCMKVKNESEVTHSCPTQ